MEHEWVATTMPSSQSQKGPLSEAEQLPWKIDYGAFLQKARSDPRQDVIAVLAEELPYAWRDAYLEMMPRATNIIRFRYGTFEYLYDDYATLEATQAVPYDPKIRSEVGRRQRALCLTKKEA